MPRGSPAADGLGAGLLAKSKIALPTLAIVTGRRRCLLCPAPAREDIGDVRHCQFRSPLKPGTRVYADVELKTSRHSAKDPSRAIETIASALQEVDEPVIITEDLVNLHISTQANGSAPDTQDRAKRSSVKDGLALLEKGFSTFDKIVSPEELVVCRAQLLA